MFFNNNNKETKRIAEINIPKKNLESDPETFPSAKTVRDKINNRKLIDIKCLFGKHKTYSKLYKKSLNVVISNKLNNLFEKKTYLYEHPLFINTYKDYYDFYVDPDYPSVYNKLFISDLKKIDTEIADELRRLGYYVKIEYDETRRYYHETSRSKMIINVGNSKKLKSLVKTMIIFNRIYKEMMERKYNPDNGSEFIKAKSRFEENISKNNSLINKSGS